MVDVTEKSFEMEDASSFVEQELEALKSIYINEIEVKNDEKLTSVSIDLHPATADNHDEQYVRMTLKFILSEEYPQAVPGISIRNPRGLSDEKLNSIMQDLTSIAESKTGCSMLFEIIEAAKEHLTNENRPCGECAICLYGFSEDDVFTKTECYHYFHSHCLARYVKNAAASESNEAASPSEDTPTDKKILCPMCRLPIQFEGSEELYPPPSAKDDDFEIDEEVLALQKKMADLYQKQLDKGGIIDIEAEKNKYLLEISNVPTRVGTVEKSSPDSTVDDADSIPEADVSSKTDENVCGDSPPLPKNKVSGSRDHRFESKNKDRPDNRQRNDRYGYNKQPRNNAYRNNSYRGNQRYNRYPKPNNQNFSRKSNDAYAAEDLDYGDEQYTEDESNSPQNKQKNVEDLSEDSHDTSPISESSPGYRSSNPQRKNERTKFSDSRKYSNDRNRSDYRLNSNRGRRYGPNDYERRGYRGNQRGSKSSPSKNYSASKNDIPDEEVIGNDAALSDSKIQEKSSETVSEQTVADTLAEKPEDDHKDFDKTPENRTRYRKISHRNNDSDANYPDDFAQGQEGRRDSFRRGKPSRGYRNNYNDRHSYRESNNYRHSYRESNNDRHSYREGNNDRHSYRESNDRQSYRENNDRQSYRENNDRQSYRENNDRQSYKENNDRQSYRENNDRQSYRENNYHSQGNRYSHDNSHKRNFNQQSRQGDRHSHEKNTLGYEDRRDYNKSRSDDRSGHETSSRKFVYDDRSDCHERDNNPQGNMSRKPSYRNHQEEQFDDVEGSMEKGNQYNGRNRNGSHYQNRDQNSRGNRHNNRYDTHNNYSSYQNNRNSSRRNAPRKYSDNSDTHYYKDDERTKSESQVAPESENRVHDKQITTSTSENVLVPKPDTSSSFDSEIPSKETKVSDMKTPASDNTSDVVPHKMVHPPPGFNNPLKKVVYGLQAANPPPGFPRS